MTLRLMLIVEQESALAGYRQQFEQLGVELFVVRSIAELAGVLAEEPCNGLLLDVPTMVRATENEKVLAHDLCQVYPSLRLRWDPRSKAVRPLHFGQSAGGSSALEQFLYGECAAFQARTTRINSRISAHFNLLIAGTSDLVAEHGERSVTLNVSAGGCFVVSMEPLPNGTEIWVSFRDLADQHPVRCEVRWVQEWGKTLKAPGMGLRFLSMDQQQVAEIGRLVGQNLVRFG